MTTLLENVKSPGFSDDSRDDFDADFPDDLREEIAPDPAPGRKTGSGGGRVPAPAKSPRPRPASAVRKRVKDELVVYAKMAALGVSVRDQHCGGVLDEQSEAIADALADIIARNPALVAWVHTSGVVGDWIKLGTALMPVVVAIRDHHITRKVDDGGTGGGVDLNAYGPYRPA